LVETNDKRKKTGLISSFDLGKVSKSIDTNLVSNNTLHSSPSRWTSYLWGSYRYVSCWSSSGASTIPGRSL
jgi:hypothetical protein